LKLSSLNSRAAQPGQGLQALHADWGRLEVPGDYQVCNSIWLLDDFTPDKRRHSCGGRHASREPKCPAMKCPTRRAPHPSEQLLLGKAGDVFVFNSHTWHGGTLNRTSKPRRAMHAYFCRRHVGAAASTSENRCSESTRAQLSEARTGCAGNFDLSGCV